MRHKVIEVSEIQKFEANIENLKGESAAVKALIEGSINDLKVANALMETQKHEIVSMMEVLETKKHELEIAIDENGALIEKLTVAFE